MAPTGRAAKRLAELTGQPAATVHRLLKLQPGGEASYDRDNPLDVDLLVVDEASMLDLILANKLVKVVPPGAHLLLVGDVDQLPSVGAGEVLRDLLAADVVPRVRLTQVFRQAADSGVISNAHRINAGRPPVLHGMRDFFLFACDDTEATATLTVEVACTRIPAKFGLDPRRDVQSLPRCTAAPPTPEPSTRCCNSNSPPAETARRSAGAPGRRPGLPNARRGHGGHSGDPAPSRPHGQGRGLPATRHQAHL